MQKPRENDGSDLFTDEELRKLIMATVGFDDEGVTEEYILKGLAWATELRKGQLLLELVLEGKIVFRHVDSDVVLKAAPERSRKPQTMSSEGPRRPPTPNHR